MDNVREKLMELVAICPCESSCEGLPGSCPDRKSGFCNNFYKLPYCAFRKLVDHLIAHGVTVQEAARPIEEWHEDFGDVLWWKFPIEEPPYVGSPLDEKWPDYHTHWIPIPLPTPPKGE